MFKILSKEFLSPTVARMQIEAPLIAKKAKAGQFIIFRIDEDGERIPLTIAGADKDTGAVTIIFQTVGYSTQRLSKLNAGDYIADFVGPLGKPTELFGIKSACVIGGGLGIAIAYPQAVALHKLGAKVDVIAGFRNRDLVFLKDEFKSVCDNYYLTTDDGSEGYHGFVSDKLRDLILSGKKYEKVIAIGPIPMMRAVCEVTKDPYIETIISMNSIMLDGTGMCGACRLTVGGERKFACVDGPDFDGHLVDFDEAIKRGRMYYNQEQNSLKQHNCNLLGGEK